VKARATLATSLAAAGLLLLSGCATTITGSARAAATLPTSAASVEEEPIDVSESVETATAETSESESATPIPPTAPGTESTDFSTEDGGGAVDADSAAWLSAFCYGFDDVMQYAQPDTVGMSDDAALQTIVDAYDGMAQASMEAAYHLQAIAQPTFPGADVIAPAINNWLLGVSEVYSVGAEAIATGTFNSLEDLQATIDSIESGMNGVNQNLGVAMGDIDPAVKATIAGLPECAPLIG